jgi:2-hydroxychromene-2-carboxylate isomerase
MFRQQGRPEMTAPLTFWFDFASTYSYLSAMRIDATAAQRGIAVDWRPFLLGPIFARQGWTTSPFNIYPAKGRYMVRDIQRLAEARGLAFRMPEPFPANSLLAARLATIGRAEGWAPAFSRAIFEAEFARGEDISSQTVVGAALAATGREATDVLRHASEPDVKEALKAATAEAERLGIFGAPSFVTSDGELFWGDDRLECALAWVASR